ncbi:MAG TPA: PA14 domain-containing protein [Oligoflexus sp.]|uniref:PA14 domain-containing protein n=1 Tax=Oligoflexus sp. TaxID=1971216 RepID=UPI002D80D9C7|nr:PA14 domain-containing protein [Oligoflexus sp.]HET9238070.1 PA14 domain-containing protein [Oligoflexus sp.]
MNQVYSRLCIALAISLALTACGESTQFREIPLGDPISAEQNPEMSPIPTIDQDKTDKTNKAENNPGYSGEENSPTAGDAPLDTDTPAQSDNPGQSETTAPTVRLFTDCEESPEKGIVANLYELPVNTAKLPDFSSLSSLRTVCLSQLNIKDRQFSEGFPGVEGLFEWFALDMQFKVNAPKAGLYEFSLAADDGAILWIDGAEIINNDGLHEVTTRTAKIYLTAGQHSFRVAYYQGPRWRIALELFWKVPGSTTRSYIPASAISRVE